MYAKDANHLTIVLSRWKKERKEGRKKELINKQIKMNKRKIELKTNKPNAKMEI